MKKSIKVIIMSFLVLGALSSGQFIVDIQAAIGDQFITKFVDNDQTDLQDYEINDTGTALVTTFKIEKNKDATITYVLPDGVELVTVSEQTPYLVSTDSSVDDSTGETTVNLHYSSDADVLNVTATILVNVDPSNFYSEQVFSIETTYTCEETGEIETNTNTITMHDYTEDYHINTKIVSSFEPIVFDTYMPFLLTNVYDGEYMDLIGEGYQTYFIDPTVDLTKIQVDMNGTDDFKTIDELGLLGAITPDSRSDYDPATGIISLGDYQVSDGIEDHYIHLNFDSSVFNENTVFKIPDDAFSATTKENNFESTIENVNIESDVYSLRTKSPEIDAKITLGASINAIKPNESDIDLFSLVLTNLAVDLNDVKLTIDIPDDMTIDSIKTNSLGYLQSDLVVTDENGVQTTIKAGGGTTDLTTPISGSQTIEITIKDMDSLTMNYDGNYIYRDAGIRFIGSVSGDDGDSVKVELGDTASATYTDDNSITQTSNILNISDENRKLELKLSEEQYPSIRIFNYEFLDSNGDELTHVNLGDHVSINTDVEVTDSYYYGSPYKKLAEPTFFISVPKQLVASDGSFGIDNVKVMSGDVDYSGKIESVTEIDNTNSSYPGGTLLRIDMDDYAITTEQTSVYIDTVVSDTIQDSSIVTNAKYSVIVDTTDEKGYANLMPSFNTFQINKITDEDGINDGSQVGNNPSIKLPIIMSSSLGATTYVDVDNSDNENIYSNVTVSTPDEEYPNYYIGNTGNYHLEMFNTDDYNSDDSFNNYVVFPDLSEYNVELDLENMDTSETGSKITSISYTTSEITSTDGWEDGNYDSSINWSTTKPDGAEVTAIRITFDEFKANSYTTIDIPFTTPYLTTEDSVAYQPVMGQSIYAIGQSSSTTGATAGVYVKKSEAPTIELNSISDGDLYSYDDTSTIVSDVLDYVVKDDYTSELVTYDENSGFSDASSDDMDNIKVVYTNLLGSNSVYSLDEFSAMTKFNVGDYEVTYTTEQDADAQVTTKTIDFKVEVDAPTINGVDVVLKYSEVPDNVKDLLVKFEAYAESHDYVNITDKIEISDFGNFEFDNYSTESYNMQLKVEEMPGMVAYTNVTLTIIDDEMALNAQDYTTDIENAPTSDDDIKDVMQVVAIDSDASDAFDKVTISDYDGYDTANPKAGVYDITFNIEYLNEETDSVTNTLTVTEEETNPDENNNDDNDQDDDKIIDTGFTYATTAVVILLLVIAVTIIIRKKIK